MAFPLPPKSMGPPSSCSWVRFPGPDGGTAHLDAADWPPHAVTSRRLEPEPAPGAARGREIQNREITGAVRTLRAQLPRRLLGEVCRGVTAIGAVWEPRFQWQKREGAGGAGTAQGEGSRVVAEARRPRGLPAPAAALSSSRGSAPPLIPLPPPARDSRPDRQRGQLIQLVGMRRCRAAQFVGKQTPGRGRYRPAASLPRTRAVHTPPRGALGLTRRDRRDCASPHPTPVPASASGRGPRALAAPRLPPAPPRPLERPAVPALLARHPAFPGAV